MLREIERYFNVAGNVTILFFFFIFLYLIVMILKLLLE